MFTFRQMTPDDIPAVLAVRFATRENAVTLEELAQDYGITPASIAQAMQSDVRGWLCETEGQVVAFAMGDRSNGEVQVVAVLPDFEGRSLGKFLLGEVVRWLFAEGHDEIWLGAELPPRGIDARRNRLTPHVGPVRLTTDLGEVFDGELYSIGGGEVSLSTHLGRITFSSQQVSKVQRMPELSPANQASSEGLPGERVRVSTPGGWIHGRLLSRDGARVTLITEGGGRITLEGVEVQPMGQRTSGAFLKDPSE